MVIILFWINNLKIYYGMDQIILTNYSNYIILPVSTFQTIYTKYAQKAKIIETKYNNRDFRVN